MQGMTYINSAIDKNRQMYQCLSNSSNLSNKAQLLSHNKTQYYNDETAVKKQKRKKLAKWLTLGFVGVTTLSTISALAVAIARKKLTLTDINNAVDTGKQTVNAMSNRLVNLDHFKNDLWTRFSNFISEKTPININKWFNKPVSTKYCDISKAENTARHLDAVSTIIPNAKMLGIEKHTYNYSNACDEIYNQINETLNTKGNRVGDVLLSGFKKQSPDESFLIRIKRGFSEFWKVSGQNVIADDKIEDIRKMCTQGLSEEYLPKGISAELLQQASSKDKTVAKKAFEEMTQIIENLLPDSLDENPNNFLGGDLNLKVLKTTIEKLKKTQDGVYNGYVNMEDFSNAYRKNTAEAIAKALLDINEIETKGMSEGISKMRDIATGDAAFDVLTMAGSVGGLGLAVAAEEEKEKRKSTIINLGIPLISTLGCSLFGCFKNIPKETGAIIGLIAGTVASQGAKAIDNMLNKKKDNLNAQA